GHELGQLAEERPAAVDGVEAFGFLLRELHHLEGADREARLLDALHDGADEDLPDAVGFEDRKRSLGCHGYRGCLPWYGFEGKGRSFRFRPPQNTASPPNCSAARR